DGSAQRSSIKALTITFGGTVNFPSNKTDALEMTRTGPGLPMSDVVLTVDTSGSTPLQTIAKVTFSGPLSEFGSLIDGRYTFRVFGDQLTDQGGQAVDADNDGTAGGTNVSTLHRLFGDANGDGSVTTADFVAFRTAFGGSSNVFDFDGDGSVSTEDFVQ